MAIDWTAAFGVTLVVALVFAGLGVAMAIERIDNEQKERR